MTKFCAAALLAVLCVQGCASLESTSSATVPRLTDWPHITSALPKSTELEAEVARILSGMTLAQKIGQMTQPEIGSVTQAQVRQYYIGSVLNGGGSWPNKNKLASLADWLKLADAYYDASMATDMAVKVPVIWGTDAIHGHGNAFGATLFPHNVGLGAAHDAELVTAIGEAVGRQVRATGIQWVFGPTLAVSRDQRWGRSYESFSEDPALVKSYAFAYVSGLQGRFAQPGNVVATAKHFMGDGATENGKDQGVARVSRDEMLNVHAQGYYGAIAAGVQTVMASFNSWVDASDGVDHGKMHGNKALLTVALKDKMGFDGFVVADWNGIAQVPGCLQASCPQAVNAGVDMFMVPEQWREFITNTTRQVQTGEIPLARIDDAVTRILRVKLRAGLFGSRPSQGLYAGKPEALLARELARRAVRESLVLLKNNGLVLPLARGKRILVVGKSADSLQNQTGGWSLGWQGTENSNSDFPAGNSILQGVREAAGQVEYSETGQGVDVRRFDAVIAVIGENPYAEFRGDIPLSETLRHTNRYPEDLSVLQAVSGRGVPVITVFVAGRPLYVNDLLNRSDAFVAAWLPGTEGKGVTDLLFRNAHGAIEHDFSGRLSFSWPGAECPMTGSFRAQTPLFSRGHGLHAGVAQTVPLLDDPAMQGGCGKEAVVTIFNLADQKPYALYVSAQAAPGVKLKLGSDLNGTLDFPAATPSIRVQTTQINTQQDAKLVTWMGPATFFAQAAQKQGLRSYVLDQGVLQFDMVVLQAPLAPVQLAVECEAPCRGEVDLSAAIRKLPLGKRHTLKIPLRCLEDAGADFLNVDVPFSVSTSGPFSAAFTHIRIIAGAANEADTLACPDIAAKTN